MREVPLQRLAQGPLFVLKSVQASTRHIPCFNLISQRVFLESLCKSQFPHKSVNSSLLCTRAAAGTGSPRPQDKDASSTSGEGSDSDGTGAVRRRAHLQGSLIFVSLNSKLESSKGEEEAQVLSLFPNLRFWGGQESAARAGLYLLVVDVTV